MQLVANDLYMLIILSKFIWLTERLTHDRWNYVKAGGAGGAQNDFQPISFYATP